MATTRDTIKNALRKAGIIALTASPTAAQMNTGLSVLRALYVDLVTKGTLGRLVPKFLDTTPYVANENERVFRSQTGYTVTFPATITDIDTGKPRQPYDGAFIVVVGPDGSAHPQTVIYDALTATWEDINVLTLTSNAPMTAAYADDIEALLGAKLADEGGYQIGPILATELKLARYHLARRDNVASRTQPGVYF